MAEVAVVRFSSTLWHVAMIHRYGCTGHMQHCVIGGYSNDRPTHGTGSTQDPQEPSRVCSDLLNELLSAMVKGPDFFGIFFALLGTALPLMQASDSAGREWHELQVFAKPSSACGHGKGGMRSRLRQCGGLVCVRRSCCSSMTEGAPSPGHGARGQVQR